MDTGTNRSRSGFHPVKAVGKVITGIARAVKWKTNLGYKKERDANNLANDEAKRELQYQKMEHQNDLAQQKHVDDVMKNQTKENQQALDKYKADQDYDIKNKQAKNDRYKTQAGYKDTVNRIKSSDYQAELNHGFTGKKKEGGKGVKPQYDESGQINFDYGDFDTKPELNKSTEPPNVPEHPTPEPDNSDIEDKKVEQTPSANPPENPTKDVPQPEPETPKENKIIKEVARFEKQPRDLRKSFKKIGQKLKDHLTLRGHVSSALNAHEPTKLTDEDKAVIDQYHEKHSQEEHDARVQKNLEIAKQSDAERKQNDELDKKIAQNEWRHKHVEEMHKNDTKPDAVDIGYNFPKDIEVQTDQPQEDPNKPSDIEIGYDDRTTPKTIGIGKNFTGDGKSIPRMMKVGYKEPKETTPRDIKLKPDVPNPEANIKTRPSDEPKKSLQTPKQQSDTKEAKKAVANQIMEKGTQDDTVRLKFHRQKKATPPPQEEEKVPEQTPPPEEKQPETNKTETPTPEPSGDAFTDSQNITNYMKQKYGDDWAKNPDLVNEANQLMDELTSNNKDKKQ